LDESNQHKDAGGMLDVDDHILEDAVLDFESMMQRDAEHDAIIEEKEAMLCKVLDEMETMLDAEPLITAFEPTSGCANPESLQQEGGTVSEPVPDPVPGPLTRSLNGLYEDIITSFRTSICPWCRKSFPRRPELEQHFLNRGRASTGNRNRHSGAEKALVGKWGQGQRGLRGRGRVQVRGQIRRDSPGTHTHTLTHTSRQG
jgi:hypothetical protein